MSKVITLSTILLLSANASAATLKLAPGTFQVGGQLTFDTVVVEHAGDNVHNFVLNMSPGLGYFPVENLGFFCGLDLSLVFGDPVTNVGSTAIAQVGVQYFLPVSDIYIHTGLYMLIDFGRSRTWDQLAGFSVPIGLLLPVTEHLALDVGVLFNYMLGVDKPGNQLTVKTGYFGLNIFF